MSLVYKSASTLQQLDVEIEDAGMLLCDASDNYVVYPNLLHLQIHLSYQGHSSVGTIPTSVVPFPSLQRLKLSGSYPYHDDVLFRGNSATLVYLYLLIDRNTVEML
ncbi:hypothetical protein GGH92_001587, partial [Coemansia sp. RSA 2673]